MDENTRKGIIDNFRKSPDEFIEFLIKENLLKGKIRDCLSDYISAHPNRPWSEKYFWIPLMPKFITLALTADLCNLSCRMCGGSKGRLRYITSTQMKSILDHIPTAELVILLAGNSEPLLNPEFVEFVNTMEKAALNWQMVSNGHLLKDPVIDVLVKYPYFIDMKISLDAARPETYKKIRGGNFENVISRLKALRDARRKNGNKNLKLTINMVGMEDNFPELPEFVELAAEIEASRVVLEHMHGNYTPGDYTKNPEWKTYARQALSRAKELNVNLMVPYDSLQELQKDSQPPEADIKPGQMKNTASPEALPEDEFKNCRCPHFYDIYIHIDGALSPCPFPGKFNNINIFDGPLWKADEYLKARSHNRNGGIYNNCHTTVNCSYIMKLKKYPEKLREFTETSHKLV